MAWSFAIINNRLVEIYFELKRGKIDINGYCYVNREEYTTKKEQKMIDEDMKHLRFSYRKKRFVRKTSECQGCRKCIASI